MENNFAEILLEETAHTARDGADITTRPGAVMYERVKPLFKEVIARKFIRPLTRPLISPRRLRFI